MVVYTTKSIELTKKFANAAERFGSDEYQMLQQARKDNPGYRVIITKSKSNKTFSGLTYEYMETYISTHDDENQSIMMQYYIRRGRTDKTPDALPSPLSYGKMKKWFIEQFDDIAEFYSNI